MELSRRCGHMSNITEDWLNTTAFGHMENYNLSNVALTELYKMSKCNIFPQPFGHQQICKTYLKDRLSQVSVQWSDWLFWIMYTAISMTKLYKSLIQRLCCFRFTTHRENSPLLKPPQRPTLLICGRWAAPNPHPHPHPPATLPNPALFFSRLSDHSDPIVLETFDATLW